MKINDILVENEIDEAPAGMVGQAARKVGAKVAGKLGMKGVAGNLATKANVGDEANRVKRELGQFMAGSGIKKGELELNDFIKFLGNAGFQKELVAKVVRKHVPKKAPPAPAPDTLTAGLDNDVMEAVAPQVIDKVIMDLVRQGFKQQAGSQQARSKYATDGGAAAGGGADNTKQAMMRFKSMTGIKNPSIAAQALAAAAKGEVLQPNQRKEIAPLLGKLADAMQDQAGQQRILTLFRQTK